MSKSKTQTKEVELEDDDNVYDELICLWDQIEEKREELEEIFPNMDRMNPMKDAYQAGIRTGIQTGLSMARDLVEIEKIRYRYATETIQKNAT